MLYCASFLCVLFLGFNIILSYIHPELYHFKLFTDDKKISIENAVESDSKELDEESLRMRHLLLTKLSDMGLSVRAYNCLKAADIDTFADLVSYSRNELMKFRNFGKKSLNEIDQLVEKMKLQFGMASN